MSSFKCEGTRLCPSSPGWVILAPPVRSLELSELWGSSAPLPLTLVWVVPSKVFTPLLASSSSLSPWLIAAQMAFPTVSYRGEWKIVLLRCPSLVDASAILHPLLSSSPTSPTQHQGGFPSPRTAGCERVNSRWGLAPSPPLICSVEWEITFSMRIIEHGQGGASSLPTNHREQGHLSRRQ